MPITRGAVIAIRAITPLSSTAGELMGFAESFNCSRVIQAEIFTPIGSFFGIESLVHGESGTYSWGEAHTMRDYTERGLAPKSSAYESFIDYALRVLRRTDNLVIAHLIGAVPTSAEVAVASLSRLNSNISGVCKLLKLGSEFNPPGSI
jgi:hypothetical protein